MKEVDRTRQATLLYVFTSLLLHYFTFLLLHLCTKRREDRQEALATLKVLAAASKALVAAASEGTSSSRL